MLATVPVSLLRRNLAGRIANGRIAVADETILPDLLSPAFTQDDLILLIDRMTAPPEKGGLNYRVLITSLHRDHGDDALLGPHGHSHGFAVDWWTQEDGQIDAFVHDLATANRYVTKIGLGGSAQRIYPEAADGPITVHGTLIFFDNSSPHVHAQTQ